MSNVDDCISGPTKRKDYLYKRLEVVRRGQHVDNLQNIVIIVIYSKQQRVF